MKSAYKVAYQNKWAAEDGFSFHDLEEGGLWKVIRAFPVPNKFYLLCGGFQQYLAHFNKLNAIYDCDISKEVWYVLQNLSKNSSTNSRHEGQYPQLEQQPPS